MLNRFLSRARILRSLYTLCAVGAAPEDSGLTTAGCRRRSLRLFDRMMAQVSREDTLTVRLELLTSACALLRDTTVVADLQREDRWLEEAGEVLEQALREVSAHPSVDIPLCLCLADYFYQAPSQEEDGWYRYLCDTLDAWAASFLPGRGWTDAGFLLAMERTLVLNRCSYMFLDASRDAVIGEAYRYCRSRMNGLSDASPSLLERWYALNTEGNACPQDETAAGEAVEKLLRFGSRFPKDSGEWLLARSYSLDRECRKRAVLTETA